MEIQLIVICFVYVGILVALLVLDKGQLQTELSTIGQIDLDMLYKYTIIRRYGECIY